VGGEPAFGRSPDCDRSVRDDVRAVSQRMGLESSYEVEKKSSGSDPSESEVGVEIEAAEIMIVPDQEGCGLLRAG
jgi:hypothetical protein